MSIAMDEQAVTLLSQKIDAAYKKLLVISASIKSQPAVDGPYLNEAIQDILDETLELIGDIKFDFLISDND